MTDRVRNFTDRLRSVLVRLLAFYALMVSVPLGIIHTLGPGIYPNEDFDWYLPPHEGVAGLTLLILASWIMTRWVDGRPFVSLGITIHRRTPFLFVFGLAFGLAMKSIAIYTISYLQAGMVPEWPFLAVPRINQDMLFNIAWSLIFIAVAEELLDRGYALQVLTERLGTVSGLIITSALFGLGHIMNEPELGAALNVVVTTTIMGLLNGILVIRTGSLWPAFASHWGINLVGNDIGLRATGADSSFDPAAILNFSNPQYWPIFGLAVVIVALIPLPVDRKGKILWERYVRRPAWPPWQRCAGERQKARARTTDAEQN